jgi:glycosyltransferase involved in cell wall biosynthesis
MTRASVVIPAHDEEQSIGACLDSLTRGMQPGELEIAVVCNGCSDRTAEVARRHGDAVRVIETDTASKSHALRVGEQAVSAFPRFYLDADVELPLASLRAVADALAAGPALAAAPRMEVDLGRSSWAVRAYYRIWTRLPYHVQGTLGSGVYAVSREGRGRFGAFPDLISDDGFVRLHFQPEERANVASAQFRVRAPERVRDLLRIKTRSQKGAVQLRRLHPELAHNDPRDYRASALALLRDPRLWLPCAVYLFVIAVTRARAYWMNYLGELGGWERDESSRRLQARIASHPPSGRKAP